ncbi:hypothetical protein HZC34_03845 [Candidatus Saganbacteria bacterium]|nr:hypothetical protein [Candidatus Saganbacteria bacterium]
MSKKNCAGTATVEEKRKKEVIGRYFSMRARAAEEFCLAAEKRTWLKIEYCGVQAPNDKPYIESWFSCYKKEEVYRNDYLNFWEGRKEILSL